MYTLNSDFATLQRLNESGFDRLGQAINQVNNGLCSGFYQELVNINGLSSQLADCCCSTKSAIADLGYRVENCCCTTQRAIDGVNYNMAMNTNALQQTLCNNTRDIIENQNANYRALHDEIVANRIEDKNAQITAQQNEINALRLAASQERQNNYLVEQLGTKCPQPAYVVQPPQNVTFPTNCCGNVSYFNGGCGCN